MNMSEEIHSHGTDKNFGTVSNQQRGSGGNLLRLVIMSFGLLCIFQAALNISLRLTLSLSDQYENKTSDTESILKNVTEERDALKRKLAVFANYSHQGWEYFNGSFYYISSRQKSWQESRSYCLLKGADLLIINNIKEQEFKRRLQKLTWIGLTDGDTESVWKWVDGTPLTTRYWGPGEPNSNGGRDEDCGEIRFFGKLNNWNDEPCENKRFWICEKTLAL